MSLNTTTTTATSLLASILVASSIGALTAGWAGAASEAPQPTSLTVPTRQATTTTAAPGEVETVIETDTQDQYDLVVWALDRFEQADLELPPLTICASEDRAECNGLNGYLAHSEGGEFVVHSCGVRFTLLHELAHAWDIYSLEEAVRHEFLGIAAATTWENHDDWHLAGGEHAANVVAWGLMDVRINQTRTRPYDHTSMVEAFSILTGGGLPQWMDSTG